MMMTTMNDNDNKNQRKKNIQQPLGENDVGCTVRSEQKGHYMEDLLYATH